MTSFETPDQQLAEFEALILGHAQAHLNAETRPAISNLSKVEQSFCSTECPKASVGLEVYAEQLRGLLQTTVNTEREDFVGHMTSALPDFMPVMLKLMGRVNQNSVKLETSGGFTDLERQVLGMLHRLFFHGSESPGNFYTQNLHDPKQALGVFCSGGTIANLMALWVARNRFLEPYGVAELGMAAALAASGYSGLAVLVSERGHYSLSKAADVLGLGRANLISVAVDEHHRMDLADLQCQLADLKARNIKVLAIVGVAGATETGSIDPLDDIGRIAQSLPCHFHVDGAWGGAAIFSGEHRHKLAGIERADSITLDAHKQLYVPMGAGMVLFRDGEQVNAIKHHASYIIRADSKDLGAYTLEGSRPAMALLLHAGLHLIAAGGYGALIDHSVGLAQDFASLVEQSDDFELMLEPELNILVYRYLPRSAAKALAQAEGAERLRINEALNQLTTKIQIEQAAADTSFVSRTQLRLPAYEHEMITVFRVVLANPHSNIQSLGRMLGQQREIAAELLEQAEWALPI